MQYLTLIVAGLGLPLAARAQDTTEINVSISTKDGSRFTGTAVLPSTLAVKTKYGDMKMEITSIRTMMFTGEDTWQFALSDGTSTTGTASLGTIEVKTKAGTLKIKGTDIQTFSVTGAVAPPPKPAPTPSADPKKPDPAKPEAKFRGFDVRTALKAEDYHRGTVDTALIVPGGKHMALLDYGTEEVVFVELTTGTTTRVKVESEPNCMLEKNGKIYVVNRKSGSLSIIDPKSFKAVGRIPVSGTPNWAAAPVLGDVIYVNCLSGNQTMIRIDAKTDKVAGPMVWRQFKNNPVNLTSNFITVLPNNRFIITQADLSLSPAATPSVYFVDGDGVVQEGVSQHQSHPTIFHVDFVGARIYAGFFVYSLDVREKIADLPCSIAVPHPTRSVVFGVRKKEPYGRGPTDKILLFDEEKLTEIGEIEVGDPIVHLVAGEKTLYALSETKLYPIDLEGRVPADALKRLRPRRIPVDLTKLPSDAEVKKANALLVEAQKALDADKTDVARAKFTEADKVDPLCNGRAGLGMVLVREKKHAEAVEFLTNLRAYPFREWSIMSVVYNQLAIAHAGAGDSSKAIEVFHEGLRYFPKDTMLLKNLGVSYEKAGKLNTAYAYWQRALKIDAKLADVKKYVQEATAEIRKATKETCETCEGKGEHSVTVEDEDGSRKKLIRECKSCDATGETWKKPCVDCAGSGKKSYYDYCETCWGSGFLLEGIKTD